MRTTTTFLSARCMVAIRRLPSLLHDDRGEGVISAAIAVLIMAFLGVAMWVGFNQIWHGHGTFILNWGGKVLNEAMDQALWADDANSLAATQFLIDMVHVHGVSPAPYLRCARTLNFFRSCPKVVRVVAVRHAAVLADRSAPACRRTTEPGERLRSRRSASLTSCPSAGGGSTWRAPFATIRW